MRAERSSPASRSQLGFDRLEEGLDGSAQTTIEVEALQDHRGAVAFHEADHEGEEALGEGT